MRHNIGSKRYFISIGRWAIRQNLLKHSDLYRRFKFFKSKTGAFTISENKLIRKTLSNNFKKIDDLENRINELEQIIRRLHEKDMVL